MSEQRKPGFETLAIHAGAAPDPSTGSRALPIHQTTAYVFEDADHAAALFNLQTVGFIYSRLTSRRRRRSSARRRARGARRNRLRLRPRGTGTGAVPADGTGRRGGGEHQALRRLGAADEEHLSQVRLEGGVRRSRRSGELPQGRHAEDQGVLHREPGQSRRRRLRHRGDRQDRRSGRRAAGRRQHAGHAVPVPADRAWRDLGAALDDQVPVRLGHVDGRRDRRFRPVRLVARRQVPQPRRAGAGLSWPELLRDLRRHGLHLPRPCRQGCAISGPRRRRSMPG